MKKKTVLIATLSSLLFFSGVSPSLASAAELTSSPTSQEVRNTQLPIVENGVNNNGEIQPMWKAKVAKEAIEKLADLIDSSYVDNIIDAMPVKYRSTFKASKNGIVKNLRALAKKGDAAEEYVQNVIVQAVMATGASSSAANSIANVLVFVFL